MRRFTVSAGQDAFLLLAQTERVQTQAQPAALGFTPDIVSELLS